MTLSRRTVVALTCIAVIGWGVLDFLEERSLEGGRDAIPAITPTGAIDVEAMARRRGFTVMELPTTMSVLARALPPEDRGGVQARALLTAMPSQAGTSPEDDRRAAIYWAHSALALQTWSKIKRGLYSRLSPEAGNLRDETLRREGTTIEIFAFTDPTLIDDRVLFARRGSLLLEAHIARGTEEETEDLVEEMLTQ